jgi:ATP-dependent DNA helicase RecQ
MAEVPRRKTRIVLTLLKRHAMVREHRGGVWERLVPDVTAADLSRELTDYEERRKRDRYKLEEMVRYCRTARCRTKMILEYFGEERADGFHCGHCDNDAAAPSAKSAAGSAEPGARREAVVERIVAPPEPDHASAGFGVGDEVAHGTFGEGMVMAIDGDRAEVDFAGHGTRTIRIEFLRAIG